HGGADLAYSGPRAPTDEQREALVAAYEQGYFAEPRETSLEALAESLELSPTAVAGRLRRGMKATVEMTLAADESIEE
ncbi:MAG: helix-turn-helix domain-containing protein, partial [Halobacteriales archaeon]